MKHKVIAPNVGESITEVSILKWNKQNGEQVENGDLLLELESDKATVEVVAEASGALTIIKNEGDRIPIGELVGQIDDKIAGRKLSTPKKTAAQPQKASTSTTPTKSNGNFQPRVLTSPALRTATKTRTELDNNTQSKPGERRVPMTNIRKKIAERLVQSQNNAAILTTFNQANMKPIMDLRKKYKDAFKAKYGCSLGFMSFFTKACVLALKEIPEVNAYIDGEDVIYHDFCNIGIAVGSDRGLVVPVVKNAESLSLPEIEKTIYNLALKARDGKLTIADMSGGTFTISNGGVYGSMLSTPILNPPQSGILGMHAIEEKPMAVKGKVEILPMMYLALSYDHRLIDGKGAVTFLVTLKNHLENPENLGLEFTHEL